MTEDKFAALLAKQMPDAEKRRRADFIVDSSQELGDARAQVRDILRLVHKMREGAVIREGSAVSAATWPSRRANGPLKLDARDRARYRNHRSRPACRASPGRDRLRRTRQPHPHGPDVPSLSQPRTRHAAGSLGGSRPDRSISQGQAVLCRNRRRLARFLGDAPLVIHNAAFDHRLSQCRARARRRSR